MEKKPRYIHINMIILAFDESNHILFMCFMKSMYYLTFLSNKQKIYIFMKNHPHKVPYLPLLWNAK